MIKQIQLRGISHSPSDRGTADGGLEDCIDLRLIEQEQAPATAPDKVTDDLATGLHDSGIDVMYIHKTNTYANYIGVKGVGTPANLYLYAYRKVVGSDTNWTSQQIAQLPNDQYPAGITSIGNMLVYTVSDQMKYAIFKDGEYTDLGTGLPRPKVTFRTTPQTGAAQAWNPIVDNDGGSSREEYPGLKTQINNCTTKEFWEYIIDQVNTPESTGVVNDDAVRLYNDMATKIWSYVDSKKKSMINDDTFIAPVLVRYAVKLYDGSYIYISEPIMLAGGTSHCFMQNILASIMDINSGIMAFYYSLNMDQFYKATVSIELDNASRWEDFIESVDIFMSTDIILPKHGAMLDAAVDWNENPSVSGATFTQGSIKINFEGLETMVQEGGIIRTIPSVSRDAFEEQMLEKANFYRIASYALDKLPEDEYITPMSQDELVVRPRLEESDAHTISGMGKVGSYNHRLVTGAQKVDLSHGHPEPHALVGGATGTEATFALFYYVRDADGVEHTVKGFDGFEVIPAEMRAYVAYPDPRCSRAVLYKHNGTSYTKLVILPMKEHPRLNASYGFWGLDHTLWPSTTPTDGRTLDDNDSGLLPVEDASYHVMNRLVMSEMDNPFVFPLGQRMRFTARILDALPVTTALSTSQFGQFPLYVFTEDGIWTVSLNDEGDMVASHPVSRDVAMEGTIAQLDQAVVFVSDQGVMMLAGSQVVCLSPNMDGHQFTLNDITPTATKNALLTALATDGWDDLVDLHLDTTDFIDFVAGCKPMYDYGRKRILFFNPTKGYAYEYNLATQTWTKESVPSTFRRVLNSYPEAMAVFGDDSGNDIFNWSVLPDYNASPAPTPRKGILVTRAFDLGEPDVRKAIRSIRIRGYYNHGDVKYILLGSMNGVQWTKLLSLRGGSYKSFRMVLLTKLIPDERISWIDIDYESRFADKLR